MTPKFLPLFLLTLFLSAPGHCAVMKGAPAPPVKTESDPSKPTGPMDDYNRGVPRTCVQGFLEATDKGDYPRAVQFLDLRNLPKKFTLADGPALAKYLRVAIDQSFWVDIDLVSNDPVGATDDGLPAYRDRLGKINVGDNKVDVLLQRIPREDGVLIWKFSNATVAQLPTLIDSVGYAQYWRWLEKNMPDGQFLGLFVWQWVAFSGLVLAALGFLWIPTTVLSGLLRKIEKPWGARYARIVRGPLRYFLLIIVSRVWLFNLIDPSVKARAIFQIKTLAILAFVVLAFSVVELLKDFFVAKARRRGNEIAAVVIRPVTALINLMVIVIGVLVWLDNMGIKITTALAGLGVGSFAVALAAQKSIEDLFGAVTLFASNPIGLGDFFRFGEKMGFVEEIGLRYTRVRTLENTLLSIPNSKLAGMEIENFTRRRKFLFHPTLRLANTLSSETVEKILQEAHETLHAHPRIERDSARIRFIGFGDYDIRLEIFSYLLTTDYPEFLKLSEELHLQLMNVVYRNGARFAVPARWTTLENTGLPARPPLH